LYRKDYRYYIVFTIGILLFGSTACATSYQKHFMPTLEPNIEILARDPDVPDLPFPDNPDPSQCGIPINWGTDEHVWVSGYYQGKLVQPLVYLYDSHLRLSVAGVVPDGTKVKIILYQQNPTLDYYLVETVDLDTPQEGWIPSPFLSFESKK